MVLTEDQIKNDYLTAVKDESKSGLYKEIKELLEDYFNNEGKDQDELTVTPKDIKDKWFTHDSRTSIAYIRRVLKQDFNSEPIMMKYKPFDIVESRTGRAYTFKREDYVDTDAEKLPF